MGIRVFITGAGGYLGGVLAAHLAALPDIEGVTGIDNVLPPAPWPDKVSLIKMDVRSPEMADVMSGHDFVIHTAFIVQWSANMPKGVRDDINFNGTRNVAQAAVRNRVRGFLYASSVAAYDPIQVHGKENFGEDCPLGRGDSPMYYWNSKALAERILSEILLPSGIVLTLFRMSYIIGPCNRATVPGFRENAVLFPGHDPRTQFVHENDVAQAFAHAIRTDMPGAFNVVPDDSICLKEVYGIIGAKPMTVPVWLARIVTYIRWRFFGSPTHPSWVKATLIDSSASNAKLKSTGWTPHYNSAEAIRTALQAGM